MKVGAILEYAYLWRRQADAGEESGRKDRPVCLALTLGTAPDRMQLFLFPITSQEPHHDRAALAISQIECRRGGLTFPAWLILDEFNRCMADAAYDLASATPRGTFSVSFMRSVIEKISALRRQGSVRGVTR